MAPYGDIINRKVFSDFEGKNQVLLDQDILPPRVLLRCDIEHIELIVTREEPDDVNERRGEAEFYLWLNFRGSFTNYSRQTLSVGINAWFDGQKFPKAAGMQFIPPAQGVQQLDTALKTTQVNQYEWIQQIQISRVKIEMYKSR